MAVKTITRHQMAWQLSTNAGKLTFWFEDNTSVDYNVLDSGEMHLLLELFEKYELKYNTTHNALVGKPR